MPRILDSISKHDRRGQRPPGRLPRFAWRSGPALARVLAMLILVGTCRGVVQEGSSASKPVAVRRLPEGLSFAHGLFRQRKFDMAAEEYQRFLETKPGQADADDARFGLASARLFQGRYKEAHQAFRDFVDKAPDHPRAPTAWYRLGEIAYMLGDLAGARTSLETFVARSSKHPNLETAWTYLGDVRLGVDDLKSARQAYEQSLALFPEGQLADRARYGLGRALAGLGDTDQAVKVLTALAAGGRSDWVDRAWFQIARVQMASGKPADAVKSLETLDRVAPRSSLKPEANLLHAQALAKLDRAPEAEALLKPLVAEAGEPLAPRAALDLATLQTEHGRHDEAMGTLDEALKQFAHSPLVPSLLFRSGEVLVKQKKFAEARKRFLKVADTAPADPWADDAQARAARLAGEHGDPAEAIRLSRSFPERFAGSPLRSEVQLVEARALMATGRPGDAVAILDPLVGQGDANAKTPSNALSPAAAAAARYDLAMALRAAGQTARADAMLATMASSPKEPLAADAQFLIGQERVEQGRHAEAIAPLNAYLAANPRGDVADHALAHLASAQVGLGKTDEAWKSLGQLADRFPSSKVLPVTRLRLAETALQAGQNERAGEEFKRVLGLAANDLDPAVRGRAQVGLARTLWRQGKPAEAAPFFASFLETSPSDPSAPAVAIEQAGALAAAGQTDAAISAYRQAAEHFPKAKERIKADLARARLLARGDHPAEAAGLFGSLLANKAIGPDLDALGETRDTMLAEQGWALVDAGKITEADAVFEELIKTFPGSPHAVDARFNLAESASHAGQHQKVIDLLKPAAAVEAGKSDPKQARPNARIMPLVLYRLARTQIELGDWNAAAPILDRLVRDYPEYPRRREARFLQGEAALHLDHPEIAEPALAAIEAEVPPAAKPDAEGFSNLVRERHVQSLLGIKRWNDALVRADSLKRDLPASDPAAAQLDFARGRALLGLARPDEARTAFQAVIDARKGGDLAAQAHLLRGETFFHQDRFREALAEFLKVDYLYDAPCWQAAALLEAGKAHERLAQWADAVETYEQLCSRFPDDSHVGEAKTRLEAARKHGSARAESPSKVF